MNAARRAQRSWPIARPGPKRAASAAGFLSRTPIAVFEKHPWMRRPVGGCDLSRDLAERSGEDAPVVRPERGNRGNQMLLHGDGRATEHAPPFRGERQLLATTIVPRRSLGDEPLAHEPL